MSQSGAFWSCDLCGAESQNYSDFLCPHCGDQAHAADQAGVCEACYDACTGGEIPWPVGSDEDCT